MPVGAGRPVEAGSPVDDEAPGDELLDDELAEEAPDEHAASASPAPTARATAATRRRRRGRPPSADRIPLMAATVEVTTCARRRVAQVPYSGMVSVAGS